jgi:peptidoglycan hydrolase-like protein with peptidoglycan-binding domain
MDASSDTGASDTDNSTTVRTPTVSGICTVGDIVTLREGGTALGTATCTTGTYSITSTSLSVGAHVLVTTFKDVAGGIESAFSPTLSVTIESSGGGGGGGGGGGTPMPRACQDRFATNYNSNPVYVSDPSLCMYALGATTTAATTTGAVIPGVGGGIPCTEVESLTLSKPVRFGTANNAADVRMLERFLNTYEGTQLPVDGVYSKTDEAAVIRWQEKYAKDVLVPYGITKSTGYVYTNSLKKIKEIVRASCSANVQGTQAGNTQISAAPKIPGVTCYAYPDTLQFGSRGVAVTALQNVLKAFKVLGVDVTSSGYFGRVTEIALKQWQSQNAIAPVGILGPLSKTKLRALTCSQ